VGLAGPSTNSAWNEQCAFPGRSGEDADVHRTGTEAARRFGLRTVSLSPLHSLSDFCYVVARRVIDEVGGADEGFGLGPCWEMEYSARAARAGFRGVWVCGAYVWRAPFTARRRREEARRFDASRRRYQDLLCGRRLRGERGAYAPHCLGDQCEHFAPRELIRLGRPLTRNGSSAAAPAPPSEQVARPSPVPSRDGANRMVTCVMPTRDRAEFALQAVRLFQRQDYEPRELIIVDDGRDRLEDGLPDDPRIRYLRVPRGETIGAKRNRACDEARGEFIAQWDDDDWYGPRRLSVQLEPLLDGRADITGLRMPVFFELEPWRFWIVSESLHRWMFVKDVHGGTLVFNRSVWERFARYPPLSLAEDASFLMQATARGARLAPIEDSGELFAYLRHAGNAWRFSCGSFPDRQGWQRVPEPPLPPEDRAFYASFSGKVGAKAAVPGAGEASRERRPEPLVSCIMPTADRRPWVVRAIAYFRRQDYPNRELVILDDGEDRVGDVVPDDSRIRYVPLESRLVLGEKRNRACELARGEVIVHWDDDDWQAPHRLRYQVQELDAHDAELCGPSQVLYFDAAATRAWLYSYPSGPRPWVAGNGLCYRRSLWQENPFPPAAIGEDTRFVWGRAVRRPLVLSDHRFMAAVIHERNSSPKSPAGVCWTPRPIDEIRTLLGPDWTLYATG
jgi:glycosyltransferase involved in cell wall biosynthesis